MKHGQVQVERWIVHPDESEMGQLLWPLDEGDSGSVGFSIGFEAERRE
jgi:hypothetical protein